MTLREMRAGCEATCCSFCEYDVSCHMTPSEWVFEDDVQPCESEGCTNPSIAIIQDLAEGSVARQICYDCLKTVHDKIKGGSR